MWDIKTNSAVKTPEIIKDIKWSKLNFPNSLNCLYQFYQNLSSNEEENLKDNSYKILLLLSIFNHNLQKPVQHKTNNELYVGCLSNIDLWKHEWRFAFR